MNVNKEEKLAIETVLDMGLYTENSVGDKIQSIFGDFKITYHNGTEREYETFNNALKHFKL